MNDLSAQYPEKVKALSALYDAWAVHAGVISFDKLEKRKGEEF